MEGENKQMVKLAQSKSVIIHLQLQDENIPQTPLKS